MTEYERIRLMNHQEYLLKQQEAKYNPPWGKWKRARQIIRKEKENADANNKELQVTYNLASKALSLMVAMEDNPPLKKIALDEMDGEPVWVVSVNHDGRWAIVNASDQSVYFLENGELKREFWFDDKYIFRYKKTIVDYSDQLKKFGIDDSGGESE